MATNNTLYVFDNYTPNVFPVRGPLITTPYEQYPYLDHPSKTKAASQGQFEVGYEYNCSTYEQPFQLSISPLAMLYNNGDERYGIPDQEQPLDLATNLLPAHPWLSLNGCKFTFVLNSVSNAARQYDMSIGDAFNFVVLSRDAGLLVLKNKTVPVSYKWNRSVSATIAFFTLMFPGFEFNDLTFELRASTPHYGAAYSPLGFCNYELKYERYTDTSLFPRSVYSITRIE